MAIIPRVCRHVRLEVTNAYLALNTYLEVRQRTVYFVPELLENPFVPITLDKTLEEAVIL